MKTQLVKLPSMHKLNHPLAPRRFVAHGAPRALSLEGLLLASFRARSIAWAVDLLIVNIVLAVISMGWTWVMPLSTPATVIDLRAWGGPVFGVITADYHTWWVVVAIVAYFGIFTYLGHGQTPGKRLMRIRVVSLLHDRISLWHCVERALGYVASTLELGFGFWQYFIHPNAQTVHDRIAETIVVSESH